MAAFNKFNAFVADVGLKIHNLNTDTIKAMLTNTLPVAANAVKGDITEIAAGNGYVAGGAACTVQSYAQSGGVAKLTLTGPTFTATGAVGPFRYVVLYNATAAGLNLIGWYDYGSAVTLANTDTFAVTLDATNGTLTIT
jgi:hypothetical protein